jgi:hypothetical protein
MTLADRLVIMRKGTIEPIVTPEEIREHPASIYVAGFVSSPAMDILPGVGQAPGIPSSFNAKAGQLVQVGLRLEKLSIVQMVLSFAQTSLHVFDGSSGRNLVRRLCAKGWVSWHDIRRGRADRGRHWRPTPARGGAEVRCRWGGAALLRQNFLLPDYS